MRKLLFALLLSPALAAPGTPLDPLPEGGWTPAAAAHLLRRAGFGGTPEEAQALFAKGLDGAVDSLLGWDGQADVEVLGPGITLTSQPGREQMMGMDSEDARKEVIREHRQQDAFQFARVREWWVQTMIRTRWPLRERMVLFWHGHFTSGYRDVRNSYHMYVQNTLFRRLAAGSFRELLHEVSKDPAMLEYLDNNRNRKEHPNENYAREVMELFTLGVGNYTEDDIKELARGLTGWTFQGNRFEFERRSHDAGEKSFLGRRGKFDGDQMLDIVLDQPAASRYLASKLWISFAGSEPDPAVVDGLAKTLRDADWQLKPALRELFRSRAFYEPQVVAKKIKSPIDLIVGLYRGLGLDSDGAFGLSYAAQGLGQSLLDPPNVKGWPGGRDWITTSILFSRYNVASAIVGLPQDRARLLGGVAVDGKAARGLRQLERARRVDPNGEEMEGMGPGEGDDDEMAPRAGRPRRRGEAYAPVYDVLGDVRRRGLSDAGQIVDFYAGSLLVTPLSPEMRKALVEYLADLDLGSRDAKAKLHGMLRLLVSTPEFQLS